MTWGRFRAGTRVWHLVHEEDTQTTCCGRAFAQRPFALQIRVPENDRDMCFRCARLWAGEQDTAPRASRRGPVLGSSL
jgi:hypothetical protein